MLLFFTHLTVRNGLWRGNCRNKNKSFADNFWQSRCMPSCWRFKSVLAFHPLESHQAKATYMYLNSLNQWLSIFRSFSTQCIHLRIVNYGLHVESSCYHMDQLWRGRALHWERDNLILLTCNHWAKADGGFTSMVVDRLNSWGHGVSNTSRSPVPLLWKPEASIQ